MPVNMKMTPQRSFDIIHSPYLDELLLVDNSREKNLFKFFFLLRNYNVYIISSTVGLKH